MRLAARGPAWQLCLPGCCLSPPPAAAGLGLGTAGSGKHGWGSGRAGAAGTGQAGGGEGALPFRGAAPSQGAACVVAVLSWSASRLRCTPLQTQGMPPAPAVLGQAVPSCAPSSPCIPLPTFRGSRPPLQPLRRPSLPELSPSLPAGESELLALSAKGRLMSCGLCSPEDADVGLTPAEAGRRIKELLSGIGNTSER